MASNVLVIDTDKDFESVVAKTLSQEHTLYFFDKWARAVSCLARNRIDLAIVGMNVSGFRCDQLVDMIRQSTSGTIIVAGDEDPADKRGFAKKFKADGYVSKVGGSAQLNYELSRFLGYSSSASTKGPSTVVSKRPSGLVELPDNLDIDEKKKASGASTISSFLQQNRNATTLAKLARISGGLNKEEFIRKHSDDCLMLLNEAEVTKSSEFMKTRRMTRGQVQKRNYNPVDTVVLPLDKGVMTVGRSPNCDIQIRDSRISKFHAYIQKGRDGQRTLQDSGSTNGTFLSGKKIPAKSTFTLNSQLIIGFGDYCKFKFLTPELLYIRVKYFSQIT